MQKSAKMCYLTSINNLTCDEIAFAEQFPQSCEAAYFTVYSIGLYSADVGPTYRDYT
jgi:hypothetical protein